MKRSIQATRRTVCLFVTALVGMAYIAHTGFAQEESVKPGINARFENADVDAFRAMFETESRAIYRYRHAIVAILDLKPGMTVADIGAGTGLFTRLISPEVGPEGKVDAVEISQNFIDHIEKGAKESGDDNIVPVLCDQKSTNLEPASVDVAFVCDTYHHFEFPQYTLASIHRALKPGGRLVVVDFERIKGVSSPWVLGHVRCGKGTVTDEIKDAGFDLAAEIPMMEEQFVLVFKKRPPVRDAAETESE